MLYHVITSQPKAWNDTVCLAMWLDIIVRREAGLNTDYKFMLWWDNCPSHKTAAVDQMIRF
jgi:hypothetical protein